MTRDIGTGRRTAQTWLADAVLAVALLVPEAGVLFVIWLRAAMSSWAASYDGPAQPASGGTVVALGVLAVFAVAFAVALGRKGWPLVAITQGCVAAALGLLVTGAIASG